MVVYKIIPRVRLICVRTIGQGSPEKTIAFLKRVRQDPSYSPEYDCLTNNSERTDVPHAKDLYQVKDALEEQIRDKVRTKTAIVAPNDANYGMSRMFEIISEPTCPVSISVFRDLTSALKWLERSESDLEGFFDEKY